MLPNVWQAVASWELLPLLKANDDRPLSEHVFRWVSLGTRRHLRTALTHIVLNLYPLKCLYAGLKESQIQTDLDLVIILINLLLGAAV